MTQKRHRRRSRRRLRNPVIMIIPLAILVFAAVVLSMSLRQREIEELERTPVESPLVNHTYNWNDLVWDGDFVSYEDDEYYSMQGIDVSQHQEEIDWKAVADSGVEFAMIRVGYRGYQYGLIHEDEYFEANIRGAKENGLLVGVYFYSQAINAEEAWEEADFMLSKIKKYDIDLPVVFDMEESDTGENGRILALSRSEKTEVAAAFLHRVRNAGYTPMVYNSSLLFAELFDIEYLQEFDIWVADYSSAPRYPYTFSIWQYTSDGTVPGVEGRTDMNIMFIRKDAL